MSVTRSFGDGAGGLHLKLRLLNNLVVIVAKENSNTTLVAPLVDVCLLLAVDSGFNLIITHSFVSHLLDPLGHLVRQR